MLQCAQWPSKWWLGQQPLVPTQEAPWGKGYLMPCSLAAFCFQFGKPCQSTTSLPLPSGTATTVAHHNLRAHGTWTSSPTAGCVPAPPAPTLQHQQATHTTPRHGIGMGHKLPHTPRCHWPQQWHNRGATQPPLCFFNVSVTWQRWANKVLDCIGPASAVHCCCMCARWGTFCCTCCSGTPSVLAAVITTMPCHATAHTELHAHATLLAASTLLEWQGLLLRRICLFLVLLRALLPRQAWLLLLLLLPLSGCLWWLLLLLVGLSGRGVL